MLPGIIIFSIGFFLKYPKEFKKEFKNQKEMMSKVLK